MRLGRRGLVLGAALIGGVGCARACDQETATVVDATMPGPALPVLVADPVSSAARAARIDALPLRRGPRPDTVELRVARAGDLADTIALRDAGADVDSVGVATVGFFHAAFVAAHPGFDLVRPVLFSPAELLVLANHLAEATMSVLAASDLAAAKARWPKSALLAEIDRDDEWAATRPVLAAAARDLSQTAKRHADANASLWLLAR